MNFRILAICFCLLLHLPVTTLTGQDINKTDENGKKQGHWIKKYPNGNILYEGSFLNDMPKGEFRRYYENSVLKSLLVFSETSKEALATLYYPNGLPASTGKYINQLKEGNWRFFSSASKDLIISEAEYTGGKKNGLLVKYYPDGKMAEKLFYKNDLKNGEYLKYYPDGTLSLRTNYTNDKLNGKFEAFYDNGKAEIIGQYKYNLREGQWIIFNKDGNQRFKTIYESGIPDNSKMDIYESEYIDSLERNAGKIDDPEKTDEIR